MILKNKKGFTILEITIAMVILLLIIFSIGILIPMSQVRIQNASHQDIAYNIADNMIEMIRSLYWFDIVKGKVFDGNRSIYDPPINAGFHNQYPPPPYPYTTYEFTNPGVGGRSPTIHKINFYIIVNTIYDPEFYPDENIIKTTVDIHWTEAIGGGSAKKSISLTSKIYKGKY